MNIAVITGASSGLGKVFYETVMERYSTLDEVWIIARREDKLKELAKQFPDRRVRVLPLDLADTKSFELLDNLLKEQQPDIKVLINNAAYDRAGLFREMKSEEILSLINLNVMGMTMINRICLPHMHKGSYEIICGSIGSFAPLPFRAVYSASKAYGRFLTRAVREEERKRGINILLLNPGAMDTEMNPRSKAKGKLANQPWLNLQKVTLKAIKKAEKGCAVYTPLAFYKAYRVFAKIVPSALAVKLTSVESSVPTNNET